MTALKPMCKSHVYNMLHSINFQRVVMQGVEMHLAGRTSPRERDKLASLMQEREQYELCFQTVLLARSRGRRFWFRQSLLCLKGCSGDPEQSGNLVSAP